MKKFFTEQENFWAGQFGNDYVERAQGREIINSNIVLFQNALKKLRILKHLLNLDLV